MDWNLNNLTLLVFLWSSTAVACALYVFVWSHRALGDEANARSLHQGKVLTSGGVFVVLPGLVFATWQAPTLWPLYGVWLMLLVGLADDVWHWSAKPKLLAQVAVSFLLLWSLQLFSPVWLSVLLLFAVVWWLNLYNFMDGANGIAGLHLAVVLVFYLLLYSAITAQDMSHLFTMLWALLGAVALFLFFNLLLGRLFLGDAGSLPLAFVQAWLALYALSQSWLTVPLLALLHASFVADATFTLFYRIINKEPLSQAHNTHFYQRWVKSGASHAKVSVTYALVTVVCAACVFLLRGSTWVAQWGGVLAVYFFMALFFIKTLRLSR